MGCGKPLFKTYLISGVFRDLDHSVYYTKLVYDRAATRESLK